MERVFTLKTGTMLCRETGNRVEVLIKIQNDGAGLYHSWLRGEGGVVQLGTLIPQGNDLVLHRYLDIAALKAAGSWPVSGGGVTLTHSFSPSTPQLPGWVREKNPGRFFPRDPILRNSASALEECLTRRKEEGFMLAIPFGTGRPFPFTPIFCFGRVRRLNGALYIIFQFRGEGVPLMSEKAEES